MSEPFLAEVRLFGFNFPPRGWATCDGQILPISQNQSLYSLLGTTYGGDGRTTFALPDLRGRTPIHVGNSYSQGRRDGSETNTLTAADMPSHTHSLLASSQTVDDRSADNSLLGQNTSNPYSSNSGATVNMATIAVTNAGGGQPYNNMQPFLAIYFCIALTGTFPPRN
ncbi:MAG: tail fiber protein [Cyanobacteria bacterium J06642_11]